MKKLLLGLLILPSFGAFGQGYELNLQGTRQIGQGSTGLADPCDATALFTNPASAAFLKNNDVTIGISPVISNGTFTDEASNVVSSTDNPVSVPFNASAVFGKKNKRLRYGLSVYTPFGSIMHWKPGSIGRFDVKEISLLTISVQPTAAYRINDKFSVGLGLIYTYGHVGIKKDLPIQDTAGNFGNANIDATAKGFGVNIGLYYQLNKKFALGLTYRSKLKMKSSSGTATFTVPASVSSQFPSQDIDATLPLPQIFGLGVTYKPTNHWVINVEGYLADWTSYDTIRVHFDEQPVAGATESDMIRDYRVGLSFRAGVEYQSKNYELRAGLIYTKSPIQDQYVSPDVPDANRLSPSIGASYIVSKKIRIDAALLTEFIHRNSDNIVTGIDGTYRFHLIIPSIGASYQF